LEVKERQAILSKVKHGFETNKKDFRSVILEKP
jgi:hypothetical protein